MRWYVLNGNYVFYHTSPTTLETIEPNKYGTNPRNVTSAEEKTAIGRVNGVSMYYPAENVAESIVSGNTHMVKIPESEVYDFNADPLNLIEEARAKFVEIRDRNYYWLFKWIYKTIQWNKLLEIVVWIYL